MEAKKKIKKITKIQALIRMHLTYKNCLVLRERYELDQQQKRIQEAKDRIIRQRRIKQAALVIEAARYRQLHRRELRELRRFLAKLPYECRRVYFKFMEVKKSANILQYQYNRFMD